MAGNEPSSWVLLGAVDSDYVQPTACTHLALWSQSGTSSFGPAVTCAPRSSTTMSTYACSVSPSASIGVKKRQRSTPCVTSTVKTVQHMAPRPTCFPQATFSAIPRDSSTQGYMSPADDCPAGFTRACSGYATLNAPTQTASASLDDGEGDDEPSEVLVGCCMAGYECAADNAVCTLAPTDGHVATYTQYDDSCNAAETSLTFQVGSSAAAAATALLPSHPRVHAVVPNKPVSTSMSTLVQSSSLPLASSGVPTSIAAQSSTSVPGAATSHPAAGSSASSSSSAGRIAGGVVGGVAGLALVLLAVFLLLRWRRRARHPSSSSSPSDSKAGSTPPDHELHGHSAYHAELGKLNDRYRELDGGLAGRRGSCGTGSPRATARTSVTLGELDGRAARQQQNHQQRRHHRQRRHHQSVAELQGADRAPPAELAAGRLDDDDAAKGGKRKRFETGLV